jgi:hypothetical protein
MKHLSALLFALLVAGATPAAALQIVSPAAGATVQPGALVTVRIVTSPGESVAEVGVFTDGEPVPAVASGGAYEAQVRIPREAVGPELLVAYALLQGGGASLARVEVNVDPGPIRGLLLTAPSLLTYPGQTADVEVRGTFEDGIVRDLSAADLGTTYSSTHPDVLAVSATGVIQARTSGVAELRVTSRGRTATAEVTVRIPDGVTNRIPTLVAGPEQTVAAETLVTLSVQASDPDGDPLTYAWEQVGGRLVLLHTPSSPGPQFIAPRAAEPQVLEFLVAVRDPHGAASLPVLVRVTVNAAPGGND